MVISQGTIFLAKGSVEEFLLSNNTIEIQILCGVEVAYLICYQKVSGLSQKIGPWKINMAVTQLAKH